MRLSTVLSYVVALLALAAAVVLAVDGFGIEVVGLTAEVLDAVRSAIAVLVWPLDVLVAGPILAWLPTQNLNVEMHDHWRSLFVLLWLLFASTARSFTEESAWGTFFVWGLAGIAALPTALAAGSVPLSGAELFEHVWSGFGLFYGFALIFVWFFRRESQSWIFAYFFNGTAAGTAASLLWSARDMPIIKDWESPGLLILAGSIAAFAISSIVFGAILQDGEGDTFLETWLGAPLTRAGAEILVVLAGSGAIVAWLGAT